jgi:hypothetical protein
MRHVSDVRCSSETSVDFQRSAQRYDSEVTRHPYENLRHHVVNWSMKNELKLHGRKESRPCVSDASISVRIKGNHDITLVDMDGLLVGT